MLHFEVRNVGYTYLPLPVHGEGFGVGFNKLGITAEAQRTQRKEGELLNQNGKTLPGKSLHSFLERYIN
jgi:hypothetical protein